MSCLSRGRPACELEPPACLCTRRRGRPSDPRRRTRRRKRSPRSVVSRSAVNRSGRHSSGWASAGKRKNDLRSATKKDPNLFVLFADHVGVRSVHRLPVRRMLDTLSRYGANVSNVHPDHSVVERSSSALARLLWCGVPGPIGRHPAVVIPEGTGLYASVSLEPPPMYTHEQVVAVRDLLDRPFG